jgi:anaerobic magnesium-protoporphyrin IX monomethyl ester cyclase
VTADVQTLDVAPTPIELLRAANERSKHLISFDDVPYAPPRRDDQSGVDITLIFPPLTKKEAAGGRNFSDKYGHMPPLGLAYLAGALEAKGYEVDAIDPLPMGLNEDDVLERIAAKKPCVVGINALTPTFHKTLAIARRIRERFPDVITIIGGTHATLNYIGILTEHAEFDLLCVGEGEATLVELMNTLRQWGYDRRQLYSETDVLSGILGIVYRENGTERFTGHRPDLDLDTLPLPARHLLPMERYIPWPMNHRRLPQVHLFVSRGCPWRCAFCCVPNIWGRKVRLPSPAKVIEEIRHAIDHFGAREINFWDDTFTAEPEWLTEVCERIASERLDIIWRCNAKVNDMTPSMARTMKKSGCWQITFGMESANEDSLKTIRKGQQVHHMKEAIRVTQDAGIEVRGLFMLGLPSETPEKAQNTIDFAITSNIDHAHFSLTAPHKGTDLYMIAEQFGTIIDDDQSNFTHHEAVYLPHGYRDTRQLKTLISHAFRQFYFRPRYIWKMIRGIRSLEDVVRYYQGFKILLILTFSKEQKRGGEGLLVHEGIFGS